MKVTTVSILLVAPLVLLVSCQSTGPISVPTQVKSAAPAVVDLDTLLSDYAANEVAANDKYKGRVLETTGSVYQVSEGGGQTFLSLMGNIKPDPSKGVWGSNCFVMVYLQGKDRTAAKQLVNGQKVAVIGTLDKDTQSLILRGARIK